MRHSVCFKTIFYTVFAFLFCVSCYSVNASKVLPKSGPYITVIRKIAPCEKLTRPFDAHPGMVFYAEVYNTTKTQGLLRGNITILSAYKNIVLTMKCFVWEDGKWKLIYRLNKGGCNNQWNAAVLSVFGIKYEDCSIAKGVYSFQNIEQNKLEHLWAATREYGKMMWRTETFHKGKTWMCWETQTEVVPA